MTAVDFSDPATIAFLAAALEAAGVGGIEIDRLGCKLRIVVGRDAPVAVSLVQTMHETSGAVSEKVTAPIMGVFHRHHPAAAAAPSTLPLKVASGETVGFLHIGPILLPVNATKAGVLIRRLAEDGSVVGYGDPLFEYEPH